MISINNLNFSFRKKVVFRDLNLHIEQGQICGLFGKNGVGKTTFLYNLAGLLFPDSGKIDILGFSPQKRHKYFLENIFVIPDEVHLPDMSVQKYENTYAPFYPKFSNEQFQQFLTDFEIPYQSRLQNLSYGQRKKVFIAFALAANTSLVLMDEPTNGLDIMSKTQLKRIMAGLMDNERCFIISTHQAKDLENLIDRVIILDEEKVLFNQSIQCVSECLTFQVSSDKMLRNEAFYAEENLLGKVLVLPNGEHIESKIDLELLYKAVITNPEKINQRFNSNR